MVPVRSTILCELTVALPVEVYRQLQRLASILGVEADPELVARLLTAAAALYPSVQTDDEWVARAKLFRSLLFAKVSGAPGGP